MNDEAQATTPEQIEQPTPAEVTADTPPNFDLGFSTESEPAETEQVEEEEAEASKTAADEGQPVEDESWLEAGLDQIEEEADETEPDNVLEFEFDYTIPELDPEAQVNETRWKQQVQGLHKMAQRVEKQVVALNREANNLKVFRQMDAALQTPEGTAELIGLLQSDAEKRFPDHQFNQSAPQTRRSEWDWDDDGSGPQESLWSDPHDTPAQKASKVTKEDVAEVFGVPPEALSEMVAEYTNRQAERALVENAQRQLGAVNARLQSQVPGLEVTAEELVAAVKARPNLPPHEAVILTHFARAKTSIAQAVRGGKKMPQLPKGAKQGGVDQADTLSSVINGFRF